MTLIDPWGSVYSDFKLRQDTSHFTPFLVEGIGKNKLTGCLHFDVIDDCIDLKDEEIFNICHLLKKYENIFAGGSSGANILGALKIAKYLKSLNDNRIYNIVTVCPDHGSKYLSKVYNDEYLKQHNIEIDLEKYYEEYGK